MFRSQMLVSFCPFSSTNRPSLSLLSNPELTRPGLHFAPHSRPGVSEAFLEFLVSHPLPLSKTGEHWPRPGTHFSPRASSSWLRLSLLYKLMPTPPPTPPPAHNAAAAGGRSLPRSPSNAGCLRPSTSAAESARDCFHLSKDEGGELPTTSGTARNKTGRDLGSSYPRGVQLLSPDLVSVSSPLGPCNLTR